MIALSLGWQWTMCDIWKYTCLPFRQFLMFEATELSRISYLYGIFLMGTIAIRYQIFLPESLNIKRYFQIKCYFLHGNTLLRILTFNNSVCELTCHKSVFVFHMETPREMLRRRRRINISQPLRATIHTVDIVHSNILPQ